MNAHGSHSLWPCIAWAVSFAPAAWWFSALLAQDVVLLRREHFFQSSSDFVTL